MYDQLAAFAVVFVAAWALAYFIGRKFKLKEYGIEVKPLYIMVRTTRINQFLDNAALKLRKTMPLLGNISILLGIGMMAFISYTLMKNLYLFFFKVQEAAPIFPAIPLVTIRLESLPYFILSVAILLVMHEGAHGIMARYEKVKVKSAGVMLIAVIPGGFVEPDEESFKKAETGKKLRILSAGSSANFAFGLIMLVLLTAFFPPTGVLINGIVENSPAAVAGLKSGDIIVGINGEKVANVEEFREAMSKLKVNMPVTVDAKLKDGSTSTFKLVTVAAQDAPNRAIIGVYTSNYIETTPLFLTVFWNQVWSINLAVVNMLPLYPLDGGSFVRSFLDKYAKKNSQAITWALSLLFLGLLLLNMLETYSIFGFVSI